MTPHTISHIGTSDHIQTNFFNELALRQNCLLLLDYDGTLAPFNTNPSLAVPYSGVTEILDALLSQQQTRVVIISGRAIADILPLLHLKKLPEIWGSHGWQRRYLDGHIDSPPVSEDQQQNINHVKELLTPLQRLGARIEEKPYSVAIHWRGLQSQHITEITSQAESVWKNGSYQSILEFHRFDGGIEYRLSGKHKGHVVNTIHSEAPDALIAYLGDDMTDEDAFKQLTAPDLGILIRTEYRPTAARLWLRPPQELLSFLQHWHAIRQQHHEST